MKKLLSIIVFVVLLSCQRHKLPSESLMTSQIILIEFNRVDYEPFGVLTKKLAPSPKRISLGKDTFFLKNDSLELYCIRSKPDLMQFEYKEDNYKLSGEFILPGFYHIKKHLFFDVETYFTNKIVFEPYIQPIRSGEWIIRENGTQRKINYDIEIDDSQLKIGKNQ